MYAYSTTLQAIIHGVTSWVPLILIKISTTMKNYYFKFFACFILTLFFTNSIQSQTNTPPTFTSLPATFVNSNTTYSYVVTTNDVDTDVVSLTATTLPSWLSLVSGTLSGDSTGNSGTFDVMLHADDGNGGTTDQSFNITANTAPTFTSTTVNSVNDNATYSYSIETSDVNKDALTITATTKPSWITLSSSINVSTLVASSSTLASPKDIAIDTSGNIYEVGSNNQIIKITPAGVMSILAGSSSSNNGFADDTGTAALFFGPEGIAIDTQGNLYVADKNNQKIRKVTPTGVVTTFAGSSFGFANGTGTAAQFKNPLGIAVDISGNVYVADSGNHMIRKITPTGVVTTLAGRQ